MAAYSTDSAITLLELNSRVGRLVQTAQTSDVWVTAEISDFSVRGGHCYMDLVEKSADGSRTVARSRGVIWANNFYRIGSEFLISTGQQLGAGMKVMVLASVSYHPVFGLSLVITGINGEFTVGDMVRRRREMIARLTEAGVIDINRSLEWPDVCNRVAVVSAPGAAGYGDFIHQLYSNPYSLRFTTRLYPATMQGVKSAVSIISALDEIAAEADRWDCVVIIRGGGASDDLACFDDYNLAECIAQFPVPVIIGIGHERDVTLLDYVANLRVKTPTSAAERLIDYGNTALWRVTDLGNEIARRAGDIISGYRHQLERTESLLPVVAGRIIDRNRSHLDTMGRMLETESLRRVSAEVTRIGQFERLVEALSPEATLKRGYTITRRVSGRVLSSACEAAAGDLIETVFADGKITSVIK